MKRGILLILLLALLLAAGCSRSEYQSPVSFRTGYLSGDFDCSEEVEQKLLSLLNGGEWNPGVTDNASDFDFFFRGGSIRVSYSSRPGIFNDTTNQRFMCLSEEDRAEMNRLLEDFAEEYTMGIRLLQYHWDGYGVAVKYIGPGIFASSLIAQLKKATETGEAAEKISEEPVNEHSGELPVTPGTLWIEIDQGAIYRLDPELTQLCRAESHLGAGTVLELSDSLRTMILNAKAYYPYDYYCGTYRCETDELQLNRVYPADSTVHVQIETIRIESKANPDNQITLTLTSSRDQTAKLCLECWKSEDNLAQGDSREVVLRAGSAETVELNFGGWESGDFWVYISADNTRIELKIEP